MDMKQKADAGWKSKGLAVGVPMLLVLGVLAVVPATAEPAPEADAHLVQLQRNLDLAGVLLETEDPIEAAKLATAWQAATLGVALERVPAPRHDAPSAAVLALVERHDVTPSPEQLEQVLALDALPAVQRDALAGVVDAFLALEDATHIAYAGADLEALMALVEAGPEAVAGGVTSLVDAGVQVGLILGTRNDFLDATVAFQEAFGDVASTTSAGPGVDLCPAVALDVDGLDTTYNDNCALVLDVGGHDTYLNNAGGNKLVGDPEDCTIASEAWAAAALVDFAGDDQYVSGGQCGHNGGGYIGVGFLLDQSGNDTYTAYGDGTNGGGILGGVGFLLDQSGNDTYTAYGSGTNGGGRLGGVGFLFDQSGNDTYTAYGSGTNGGGYPGSVGFLFDQSGNDTYTAYGDGTNGGGSGGVGFLLDASGTDGYQTGSDPVVLDQTIVPKGTVGAQIDTEALTDDGSERILLSHEDLPLVPDDAVAEPLGLHVASLVVYDDGSDVCVDIVVVGGPTQNLGCVASALLGPADGLVGRGETKLVVVDDPDGTPEVTADVHSGYHYDGAHLFRAANLLGGAAAVWSPFAPGDEAWFLADGASADVFATVTVYVNGQEVETVPASVPYLGQVLAAAEKTAGTL